MIRAIGSLAEAIRRAASEHGLPNSFNVAELEQYGAPSRLVCGRIGNRDLAELQGSLGSDYQVAYITVDGRKYFEVSKA